MDIIKELIEAYKASTKKDNLFEKKIKAIKWENHFEAEGEHYFELENVTFITPSFDPFECNEWSCPSAIIRGAHANYLTFSDFVGC